MAKNLLINLKLVWLSLFVLATRLVILDLGDKMFKDIVEPHHEKTNFFFEEKQLLQVHRAITCIQ